MVSLQPPICDFGWKAIDFNLEGVDGKNWTLEDARGPNGRLVMFICNHYPYVKAITDPKVVRTIKAGRRGRIGLAYFEWAGDHYQRLLVDWAMIHDAASAKRFANELASLP